MKAIEIVDDKPITAVDRCIGCGLCATGCPEGAMHLEKDVAVPEPPANANEFGLRILQGRGKLEAFMEVMNPPTRPSSGE
jgi:Fe-S-cluster-containing hydrogenase component 2